MFTKILSPVQSAWFITSAYPLKFDCQALASAVCQIWSHMCAAPTALPPQARHLHRQPAARQQLTQLLQQQQQRQQQQAAVLQVRSAAPTCRLEPAPASAEPSRREAAPASLEALQATEPGAMRQPGLMLSHPAPASLGSIPMQQHYPASQVPQMHVQPSVALHSLQQIRPAAQRVQHQRPVHAMEQLPIPQRVQHAQAAQVAAQMPPAQRAQQLRLVTTMAEPSVTQQATQPAFPSLSLQQQVQEMESRHRRHLMQQSLGVPPAQMLPSGPNLQGMRPSNLNHPMLSGQSFAGLGALQASDSVPAGILPRPTAARLPMAVP